MNDLEYDADIIVDKFIKAKFKRFSTYFEKEGQYYEVIVQKLSKQQVKRRDTE